MVSGPPGRSATVTSLSGRVNALKFMQRASPSSTPTKPTSSTSNNNFAASASTSTPASASPSPAPLSTPGSPAPTFQGAQLQQHAQDERWSLSPAAIAKLRAQAQANQPQTKTSNQHKKAPTVNISQEAGFDAWLITREKESLVDQAKEQRVASRQTFGRLGKKQTDDEEQPQEAEGEEGSKKRSRSSKSDNPVQDQDQDDSDGLEPDFDSQDEASRPTKRASFIKPGSLSKANSKENPSPSPSAKKSKRYETSANKTKDPDTVVFARKRGGKPGISGGGGGGGSGRGKR